MAFSPISFSSPQGVAQLAQGVQAALQLLGQTMQQGAGALQELPIPSPEGGMGGSFGNTGQARQAATTAMATPVQFFALTPFQYGVGERRGEEGFLPPTAALQALGSRIHAPTTTEAGEAQQEDTTQKKGLVALLFAAPTQAALAQALGAFTQVYPQVDLQKAMRRASALASLEQTKFVQPQGGGFPPSGLSFPQKEPVGQALQQGIAAMLGRGEAAEEAQKHPAQRLAEFAQKQAENLQKTMQGVQQVLQSLQGSPTGVHGLYLEGTGGEIARELAKTKPPVDDAHKCSAIVGWQGTPGSVAFYKQGFGL
ncbi:hypothetical protein [Desulfovibrio cuneatus]|uniref:hypothetical protein n=1 Tax=Desulfovibrio cuneatus TaxID=159728 RepID=UPI000410A2F9|nr:hypothetical protein [Desulfovibrio cuneatus]